MARPPVEWPIPVYVAELRERVVVTYRVPPAAFAGWVPAPVHPVLVGGQALVSLCLGNGRCLKSAGEPSPLASEFHVAELVTPVRWQGACRPAVRGLFLLSLLADAAGPARLLRTALEFDAGRARHSQGAARDGYACRVEAEDEAGGLHLRLPRTTPEAPWRPESVFDSHEDAEALLLHPECHFVPDRSRRFIRMVPVHQYARATTHLAPEPPEGALVARLFGLAPDVPELDHVFYQKRCTHTWSFPPETIVAARDLPAWVRPERSLSRAA